MSIKEPQAAAERARLGSEAPGTRSALGTKTTAETPDIPEASELADLLEFIYLMPIGVLKFRADGTVEMLNPVASQLLVPLIGKAGLGNIYDSLRDLCPVLADKVTAFRELSGTIVDQHRISSRLGNINVTLSLTVTRVREDVYMAAFKDISRLTEMLTYAFASADLLVDVDEDGTIGWAGGAFPTLLGMQPEEAVGKSIGSIVAPRNRETMDRALMVIATRGRLPPLMMRLANKQRARCVVAGLTLGSGDKRYLMTIGPPALSQLTAALPIRPPREFSIELENSVRHGEAGLLGLLDVRGWQGMAATLAPEALGRLDAGIAKLADEAGEDVVIGQLSNGRYGVIGAAASDIGRLGAGLQELFGNAAADASLQVENLQIDLDTRALTLPQSLQALRLALSRFTANGSEAAGLADGLVGIIEQASGKKRALAARIAAGKFTMVHQPVVFLDGTQIHHYEALLRPAAEPGQAALNPFEFVTLVEAVGLSRELDLAVLERTLAALAQTDASVAINVSGDSIADAAFVRTLLDRVEGVKAGRLIVEVTESAEIRDMPAAAAQVRLLRRAHIPVCLDDFGAGSASFRYVRDLEVDFVKIDGTFVRAAGTNDQSRSIVTAMRDLATSSGAQTIAEMIETEAEAALMRQLGIGFGQGWLFGKPGPLPAASSPMPAPLPLKRWSY